MKQLICSILFVVFLISCNKKEDNPEQEQIVEKPKIERFGFVLEEYQVVYDTIESGDTFGKILGEQGLSATEIHNVVEKIRDSINLKNIRVGKPFMLLKGKEEPNALQAIVYESDLINYSVIDFRNGISAHNKQQPVTVKRRVI
ncbi:MAG: M23 family peptidase, partial [Flavobacteriaceae bacterium]